MNRVIKIVIDAYKICILGEIQINSEEPKRAFQVLELNLGIWRRDKESTIGNMPGSPKPIYNVFRDVDNENADKHMELLRGILDEASIGRIINNFNTTMEG